MTARRGFFRGSRSRSLKDELGEFVLESVEVLGEKRVLGTGSYGSVQEIKINGEVYAAKMIHEILLETDERSGAESVAEKYLRECRLMSRIRHPNITQFIGVCFLAGSHLPLLVMERLDCSVEELVETIPSLPLSVSVYVLMGVCRGLLHLHHESVVHRDLTARNVLLTGSLKAKITDFSNSRLVDMEPGQLAMTLTRFPGTLVYMPPEVVSERGQYGPSLDMFSFGVLMLFILIQVFPGDLLSPTYPDPNNPGLLLGRSEFERRSVYTSHLERSLFGRREASLFGVVKACLSNDPKKRPTASDLLSSLEKVGTETDEGILQLDIARVKTARSLKVKQQRIEELQGIVTDKDNLLAQKSMEVTIKDQLLAERDTQLAQSHVQIETFQAVLAAKDDVIAKKDRELASKDDFIAEKKATIAEYIAEREALVEMHREEIELKSAELARRAVLIHQLEELVYSKDHEIQEIELSLTARRGAAMMDNVPPQKSKPPLILNWKQGKHMPIKMGETVQSVVTRDSVYVGGGSTRKDSDECTVMKLNLQQDIRSSLWTKLPQYSSKYFAMTSLRNQLVLVGGCHPVTWEPTNQVAVFELGTWTRPYLPMNIARYSSTAVCFEKFVIVAGGVDNRSKDTSSVEILDVALRRWFVVEPLPHPRSQMKSTLVGNTLYLLGGSDHTASRSTKVVHKVDLNELITKTKSKQAKPTSWQVIEETPLQRCAPVSVNGSFFAVGGCDDDINPSSSIYLYQPDANRWMKVGDLPTARYHCTCSLLSSGEIIVAGGQTSLQYLNSLDFLSIS